MNFNYKITLIIFLIFRGGSGHYTSFALDDSAGNLK